MHTVGTFAPASAADARRRYEEVGPAAQTVVREVAKAMAFDREEYDERVTGEVVETARDALFASLLEVRVGSRAEFDDWRESYAGDVTTVGHADVDRVAWHVGPEEAVAATFQNEEEAAIATLRRQAFGRLYREVVKPDGDADTDANSDATTDTDS